MKIIINILLIILAVILQMTIIPKIAIFGSFPNIILLVAISLLFINRTEESLWWVGIGGILLDVNSGFHFGTYTFSLLVVFALSYYLIKYIFSDPSLYLAAGIFFISSLIFNLIFLLFTHYYQLFLIEAIYSTFAGCIIYGLIRYYYKQKEEVKITLS